MYDAILYFRTEDTARTAIEVYLHYDGEPEQATKHLENFFDAMKDQCFRTAFDDPENVATKFVVWVAHEIAPDPALKPLDFGGVYITRSQKTRSEARDPENEPTFAYDVVCKEPRTTPEVSLIIAPSWYVSPWRHPIS